MTTADPGNYADHVVHH
jgi:hypothetical protein